VNIRAFAWRYQVMTAFECGSVVEALIRLEYLVDDADCSPDRIEADGSLPVLSRITHDCIRWSQDGASGRCGTAGRPRSSGGSPCSPEA
jgi:hypothetical protein